MGWRVPKLCEDRQVRSALASCTMADLPWPQVVEFFGTRYRPVEELDRGLRIVGKASAPGRTPPRLQVVRAGERLELIVLPGDRSP